MCVRVRARAVRVYVCVRACVYTRTHAYIYRYTKRRTFFYCRKKRDSRKSRFLNDNQDDEAEEVRRVTSYEDARVCSMRGRKCTNAWIQRRNTERCAWLCLNEEQDPRMCIG